MASLLRGGAVITCQSVRAGRLAAACFDQLVSKRWVAAGSAEHTLHVRQQIQDTRKKALQGGGAKRIEAQHKKVHTSCRTIWFYIPEQFVKGSCMNLQCFQRTREMCFVF
jgi:hypothetical protein